MKRLVVPLILSCLVVSLSANSAGWNKGPGNGRMGMSQLPTFTEIDTNQDAMVTPEEFSAFQNARQELRKSEGRLLRNSSYSDGMFERIDTNGDGIIDQQEFLSHRGSMRSSKI